MNDHIVWRDLDEPSVRRTHLRLAVKPIDVFTGDRPIDDVRVRLRGVDVVPIENPSGYYLFSETDSNRVLPDSELTIRVEGSARYQPTGVPVTPSSLPQSNPVKRVMVAPSTSYPFPSGATLVRGRLRDESNDSIVGAEISIRSVGSSTTTNQNGEFVCFFTELTESNVVVEADGTRRVVVDGDDPVLDVSFDGWSHSVPLTVLEETTTKVELTASENDIAITELDHI